MVVTEKNKQLLNWLKREDRSLNLLISPSWLSGLVVIVIALVVVGGAIASLQFHGSAFRYLQLQYSTSNSLDSNYQSINSSLGENALVSNIPLFIFWGGVGLIVYWTANGLAQALRRVVILETEMNYVHADRRALLRQTLGFMLIRVSTLIVWFFFAQFTINVLLPYVLAVAYAAAGAMNAVTAAGYIIWGVGLSMIMLHGHVVLLRLLALRPRLFGS